MAPDWTGGFSFYYTEIGLQKINSDIETALVKIISKGDITLADLSKELGMSASTALFNTNKLENKKIVRTYRDISDRRKLYYSLASVKILSSLDAKSIDMPRHGQTKMNGCPHDAYVWMLEYASAAMIRTGLCPRYIVGMYGASIVHFMKDRFVNRSPAEGLKVLQDYIGKTGEISFTVDSADPMTVSFVLNNVTAEMTRMMMCYPSMICLAMEFCTGKPHRLEKSDVSEDGNSISLTFVPDPAKIALPPGILTEDGLLDIKKRPVNDDFCIVLDKEYPVILDNSVQIGVVRILEKAPRTFKALCGELGCSASTLFANLAKLEEAKIVFTDRGSPGVNVYEINRKALICRAPETDYNMDPIRNILRETVNNPELFLQTMFKYTLVLLEAVGLDTASFQHYIGRALVEQNADMFADMTADDALKLLLCDHGLMGNRFEIESFIPLTITKKNSFLTEMGGYALTQMCIGCVTEIIRQKTGRTYAASKICSAVDGTGEPFYRFSVEPERCSVLEPDFLSDVSES